MDEDRSTGSGTARDTGRASESHGGANGATSNGGGGNGVGGNVGGGNGGRSIWERLRGLFGAHRDTSLRESLQDVIDQHDQDSGESDIGPDARSMMLNLLAFGEMRVDDVMVPRANIISIEDRATMRDLLASFIDAQHSRLPVYRETLDEPVGMVHVKDLMQWLSKRSGKKARRTSALTNGNGASKTANGTKAKNGTKAGNGAKAASGLTLSARDMDTPVARSDLMRPLLFVPPSMAAADLLVKMQSTRSHMAIVVDEYGGTDGLVTIEDLVEEIVGDIADEHDTDKSGMLSKEANGNYLADAHAPIEDVEGVLGVDLLPDDRDEEIDTLGGMIFTMLGRVPARGELVRHDSGMEFEVLNADPRRVKRLRIHTRPRKAAEAGADRRSPPT